MESSPLSLKESTVPSLEPELFTDAMRRAPTAVYVVTTAGPAGRWGLTVSAVASVSVDPPLVLACVNRRSPAALATEKNRVFSANLLSSAQIRIAQCFAGLPTSYIPFDFACAEWERAVTGCDILVGATASFDCTLEWVRDAGTHLILIGRVVARRAGTVKPLLYFDRNYGSVAQLRDCASQGFPSEDFHD